MKKVPGIAIDARLYNGLSTGDSTYWTQLINHLLSKDRPFRIGLFSDRPAPEIAPKVVKQHWRVVRAIHPRVWSLLAFPLAARRLGYKLIHTQYSVSPFAPAGSISTIHDISFKIGPEWFQSGDLKVLNTSIPITIRDAGAIITVSENSKREIELFYPNAVGKTHAIHNGRNLNLTRIPKDEALRIVKTAGIPTPFVLSVCSIWPRKNIAHIIKAVDALPAVVPHRLVLTGRKHYGELPMSNRAHFTGYVDEGLLSALYCAADLYLCPSLHEGFGIPLLEAFHAGCPVICSDRGALPEVAGEACEIVGLESVQDWTAAIRNLLADSGKLEDYRQKGFERAAHFDWETAADQTARIYESCLQDRA